jgi:hypothetical protein
MQKTRTLVAVGKYDESPLDRASWAAMLDKYKIVFTSSWLFLISHNDRSRQQRTHRVPCKSNGS